MTGATRMGLGAAKRIHKSKGAVFTDHLKREAMQLGIDL